MGTIESATFRHATLAEVQAAKGGIAWQCGSCLWDLACRIMGTVEMAMKGPNILAWHIPYPQQWADRFSHWLGLYPEQPFVQKFFTFIGDRYYVDDKKILDAFFAHHRNDEVFGTQSSLLMIYKLIQQIFPKDQISQEDFILTCTKHKTKIYHDLLYCLLNRTTVQQSAPMIQETVEKTLKDWHQRCQQGGTINATEETRLFTSSVVTQLMFGTDTASKEIAESINFMNGYILKQIVKKATDADRKTFENSLSAFRKATESILARKDVPLFNQANDLTIAQKKALIFVLFFAGQETTAALLNYMLWQIALKPDLQRDLHECIEKEAKQHHSEALKNYFNNAFRVFNPAYGVGRMLKEDTCLEYKVKGEDTARKVILYKGKSVSAYISVLAAKVLEPKNYNAWHAFGAKVHRCPGDQLAVQEILQFIATLVANYTIDTQQKQPIPKIGFVTTQLAQDVHITLKLRETSVN